AVRRRVEARVRVAPLEDIADRAQPPRRSGGAPAPPRADVLGLHLPPPREPRAVGVVVPALPHLVAPPHEPGDLELAHEPDVRVVRVELGRVRPRIEARLERGDRL